MQHRSWGSHFAIGRDIVCGFAGGKWMVALVSAHTGDYFYDYMPLEYNDEQQCGSFSCPQNDTRTTPSFNLV